MFSFSFRKLRKKANKKRRPKENRCYLLFNFLFYFFINILRNFDHFFINTVKPVLTTTSKQRPPVNNGQSEATTTTWIPRQAFSDHPWTLNGLFFRPRGWSLYLGLTVDAMKTKKVEESYILKTGIMWYQRDYFTTYWNALITYWKKHTENWDHVEAKKPFD